MKTIGIDLAASPPTTAMVTIDWTDTTATVRSARVRCTDDTLLEALSGLRGEDRVGVDCPFGWPTGFVKAIRRHHHGRRWPGRGQNSQDHRRTLAHRETDQVLISQRQKGQRGPLSMAFDKLGATTARWAHLADELGHRGYPVDRTGAGRVAEVYPAAARATWGLAGERSLRAVAGALPGLTITPDAEALITVNEHAYDALICAFVARAIALRDTTPPAGRRQKALASREGWIHVPNQPLTALLPEHSRTVGDAPTKEPSA